MGTTTTTLEYESSQFVAANGQPNAEILKAEIETAGHAPTSVAKVTDSVVITFAGVIAAAVVTAVDALVAAHLGAAFNNSSQTSIQEATVNDDTGGEVVRNTITSGPLPKGTYLVGWYTEVALTNAGAGSGVTARLNVGLNGGALAERGQFVNDTNSFRHFSGSSAINVQAGGSLALQVTYQRTGAPNPARIRRSRLYLLKMPESA